MTPALLELVVRQQEAFVRQSFGVLQGLSSVPRAMLPAVRRRGFATPHQVVCRDGPFRLLEFAGDAPPVWAEPILLCPAPLFRPFILDLGPARSVIRQLQGAGFAVYLIDWGVATEIDRKRGLADCVGGMITRAVEILLDRWRISQIHLLGHCLGGTLACIFTALYPSSVKDLILVGVPIDFDDGSLAKAWTNPDYFDVDTLVGTFGCCPGSLLRSCFAMMNPVRTAYGKFAEFAERCHDEQYVASFLALEQWAGAQVAVPAALFRDVMKLLYQRNLLARGQLEIQGTKVRLDRIACPALLLTATADHLASPRSALALVSHICSRDVSVMSLEGGHESLVVSARAHGSLWPEAAQWIADHSTTRTGPELGPGEIRAGRRGFGGSGREVPTCKISPLPTA